MRFLEHLRAVLNPTRPALNPSNTRISSEDRVILAFAGFVCFISSFDGVTATPVHPAAGTDTLRRPRLLRQAAMGTPTVMPRPMRSSVGLMAEGFVTPTRFSITVKHAGDMRPRARSMGM